MKGTTGKRDPQWPVTVGVYGMLFLFGAVQGLIGSFQYSRASSSVPVAALISCAVIREVRPQVLVTYDANGFYGHPDHIQAHRVAWDAFQQAAEYGVARFYATAAPDSDQVTTEIDATAYLDRKQAAMRAHATQITVDPPYFALSNQVRYELRGVEYYTRLAGPRGPGERETDLFWQ